MANPSNAPSVHADDLPIAVRRKRRSSSALARPDETSGSTAVQGNSRVNGVNRDSEPPLELGKTPTKPKKRVRFSDPTPGSPMPSSSTGLTPYISRTLTISQARDARDSSPPLRPQARRRLSLPLTSSMSLPSPSLSPSPTSPMPISGEVQFVPLRQALDGRMKRRLRRNHLSEEMNNIQAEKRTETQWRREICALKEEIASFRQRQNNGQGLADDHGMEAHRIQKLEHELQELKKETSQEPNLFETEPFDQEEGIFIDDTLEDFVDAYADDSSVLQDRTPMQVQQTTNDTAVQASLLPCSDPDVLRNARLSLEYLFPGEIALGLIPEDPQPLLDVMLVRLETLKTQVLVAEDSLSTTQMQESNLRTQFNAVLEQLDRSRRYAEKVSAKHAAEKARADSAQIQLQSVGQTANQSQMQIQYLENECAEKEVSNQKLQTALDTYRVEVGKLEELINRIEGDQEEAVRNTRSQMDEAVADLECHVAAETAGRREAEAAVVERDAKIVELRNRENDLMSTVNEKQMIIRDLETLFAQERSRHESSLGFQNVRIGNLSNELSEVQRLLEDTRHQRFGAEQACALLAQKLQEERDAGLRALAAVQTELASCASNTHEIKAAHEIDVKRRGEEVAEHKGLLTPVTVTRFKDADVNFDFHDQHAQHVDGHVQVRRGKGRPANLKPRPDSGIHIVEEDDEEEMAAQ